MKFTEEKRDLSYRIKGNRLKRDSDKMKESIGVLEKELLEIEENKIKLKQETDILNKCVPNGHCQ